MTSWIISHLDPPPHTCADMQHWRSMGPTLSHSLSASNTHPPPSLLVVVPLFFPLPSFSDLFFKTLTWQCSEVSISKVSQESYQQYLSPFPVSFPIFIIEKRRKNELNAHSVPLTRPPLCIHFLSPFRGGMVSERWQQAQEFYREHSQST